MKRICPRLDIAMLGRPGTGGRHSIVSRQPYPRIAGWRALPIDFVGRGKVPSLRRPRSIRACYAIETLLPQRWLRCSRCSAPRGFDPLTRAAPRSVECIVLEGRYLSNSPLQQGARGYARPRKSLAGNLPTVTLNKSSSAVVNDHAQGAANDRPRDTHRPNPSPQVSSLPMCNTTRVRTNDTPTRAGDTLPR